MFKRYTDYSNAELSQITDEELENIIDVECMLCGVVPNRIEPIYMDVPEITKYDAEVYEVGNFKFTNLKDAEKVKDLINSCESLCNISYDYNYGYENGYVSHEVNPVSVTKKSTYTKSSFDKAKDIISKINKIKKDNECLKKQFNSESKSYMEIRDKVENAVYEATKKQREFETAERIYDRYLTLSNGDAETAQKFFLETEFSGYLAAIKGCDKSCTTENAHIAETT